MSTKTIFTPLIILLALITSACSDDRDFTIEGTIEGASAQSITLTYFADGGLKSVTQSAQAGTFLFKGESAAPTMAVITVAPENTRIATLVVSNGDHISLRANLEAPLATKVEGNSDSEKIARWVTENMATLQRANALEINNAVSRFVESNKKSLAAPAILASYFQADGFAARADSLIQLLDRDKRSPELMQGFAAVVTSFRGTENSDPVPFLALYSTIDSMIRINPAHHNATLLCFLDTDRTQRDSVAPPLRQLTDKYPFSRLAAVEISTAPDSASWRQSLGRDSVSWPQTWVQGSVAAAPIRKLAIRRIPYFIAADSTGRPIYRGPSISAASAAISDHLK